MQEHIDFTNCKVISSIGYNGGNGTKKCIEYKELLLSAYEKIIL